MTGVPAPTVTVLSGELPPGLSLVGAPELTGTPTGSGTFTFTLKATNSSGSSDQTFTVTIDPAQGTATSTSTSSNLPLTGFDAAGLALLGAGLIIGGGLLRQTGRHRH